MFVVMMDRMTAGGYAVFIIRPVSSGNVRSRSSKISHLVFDVFSLQPIPTLAKPCENKFSPHRVSPARPENSATQKLTLVKSLRPKMGICPENTFQLLEKNLPNVIFTRLGKKLRASTAVLLGVFRYREWHGGCT